jgi:hypothetical protein
VKNNVGRESGKRKSQVAGSSKLQHFIAIPEFFFLPSKVCFAANVQVLFIPCPILAHAVHGTRRSSVFF